MHIKTEMELHLNYCASFGITREEMERTPEKQGLSDPPLSLPMRTDEFSSTACTAYSRYILDIGQSQDWLALQVALAPCLIGYGMIAQRLYNQYKHSDTSKNRYWKWVMNYVADDYVEAVKTGSGRFSHTPSWGERGAWNG